MASLKYKNTSSQIIKRGDYVKFDKTLRGIEPSILVNAEIVGIADTIIYPRRIGSITPIGAGNINEEDVAGIVSPLIPDAVASYLTANPPTGGLSIDEIKEDEEIAQAIEYTQNPPPSSGTGSTYMPSGW